MTDTPRMSALRQLSNQIPVANAQVAKQQQAARQLQVQQAVQQANPNGNITQTAQSTGTAVAQQAGQQQVQNAQAGQQQLGQIAATGLQQGQQQAQSNISSLQAGAKDQQLDNVQKLAQIDQKAKQELYDARRQFTQDQLGQKFTNERQLADYARLRATSDQGWQDYQQQTTQLYNRKTQMLQTVQQKLQQQLEFEDKRLNQLQDQASRKDISGAQAAANQKILEQQIQQRNALAQHEAFIRQQIAEEQADAANRTAMISNVTGIAGAVVGGVVGGPVGASAGYAVGKGVGGMAAGATQSAPSNPGQ